MSYFDGDLVPQNTPESAADPFVTALTAAMDHQPQEQMGNFPCQDSGYQLPPGTTAGGALGNLALDDGFNPQGVPGGGGGGGGPGPDGAGGDQACFMWQQSNYMGGPTSESGFISQSTTNPPSDTGHAGGGEDDGLGGPGGAMGQAGSYSGAPSITPSSLYDLDSQSQSEVSSVHSFASEREVEDKIPNFIQAFHDSDQVVIDTALVAIVKFSRKEKFLRALVSSEPLVSAIVHQLNCAKKAMETINPEKDREEHDKATERARNASTVFKNMSGCPEGRRAIVCLGGVAGITAFLSCPETRVLFITVTTVHNVLLHMEDEFRERGKDIIRQQGGVQNMVWVLQNFKTNHKLLAIVTDCLRILSMQSPVTKQVFLEFKGPQLLVEIMQKEDYKNLILMTSRLLKVLSVCPLNKQAIIGAGGIDAIAKHLGSPCNKTKLHCVWALRNLSDAANNIGNLQGLVRSLVELLKEPDIQLLVCSAGIIFNLTCNNQRNKLAVFNSGGLQALVYVMRRNGGNTDLLDPSISALRHLTNNHEQADHAQHILVNDLDALPFLLQLLEHHMMAANGSPTSVPHWPSIRAILGLLRNIAQRPANRHMLREKGVVLCIRKLFIFVSNMVLNSPPLRRVDGVSAEEVIETSAACIYHMAKDPGNHPIFRADAELVHMLARLSEISNAENLQRTAVGTVHEVSFDPQAALMIGHLPAAPGAAPGGILEKIAALTANKNEKTAAHARGIVYNVEQAKNGKLLPPQQPPIQPPPQQLPPPPQQQAHHHHHQQQMMQGQQAQFPTQQGMPGFEEAMMEGPAQPPMGAVAGGGGDFMDLMSPDGAGGGFNQFLDDNM